MVSSRRDSAPERAISATFLYMTTVSSTNTESGQSSSGSTSTVSQPCARRTSTYVSHWSRARSTSTFSRSTCVTRPSARRGLGRRTRAFLLGTRELRIGGTGAASVTGAGQPSCSAGPCRQNPRSQAVALLRRATAHERRRAARARAASCAARSSRTTVPVVRSPGFTTQIEADGVHALLARAREEAPHAQQALGVGPSPPRFWEQEGLVLAERVTTLRASPRAGGHWGRMRRRRPAR